MEDNEHINKHLKQSLDGYLVQPRISSFDEIQKKLEKKKKRRFFWILFPGVFLLMIGTGLFFRDFLSPVENREGQTVAQSSETKSVNFSKAEKGIPHLNPPGVKAPARAQSPVVGPDKLPDPGKQLHSLPGNRKSRLPQAENPVSKTLPEEKDVTQEVPVEPSMPEISAPGPLNADVLETELVLLPVKENDADLIIHDGKENAVLVASKDSTKKQKSRRFFIGVAFNPQLGAYLFQKNRNMNDQPAAAYLASKRGQNKVSFNYAFGIKGGMILREKWELMLGLGFQKYVQQEKIKTITTTPTSLNGPRRGFVWNSSFGDFPAEPGQTYTSVFRYWDYSLELSRFFQLKHGLKTKIGLGFHSQKRMLNLKKNSEIVVVGEDNQFYLSDGRANSWQVKSWMNTIHLKAGLIEDLNKTIQVQFCPTLYCSINSMYAKSYLIRQKSIGLGLECLLLFKIP